MKTKSKNLKIKANLKYEQILKQYLKNNKITLHKTNIYCSLKYAVGLFVSVCS